MPPGVVQCITYTHGPNYPFKSMSAFITEWLVYNLNWLTLKKRTQGLLFSDSYFSTNTIPLSLKESKILGRHHVIFLFCAFTSMFSLPVRNTSFLYLLNSFFYTVGTLSTNFDLSISHAPITHFHPSCIYHRTWNSMQNSPVV